jgi:MazG family protein
MVERSAMRKSPPDPRNRVLKSQPSGFNKLCEIVARLRAPGGCPWDGEQTHESLLPALIEEAYEVAGAVRANDSANFREELGDLLLLIVMHAEIARETGRFNIDNVLNDVTEKLVRRHPNVFGKSYARDRGADLKQLEAIKREEKKKIDRHYLDGLPEALPALVRAQKAQSKVARVNFDWSEVRDVIAKVEEELDEAKLAIKKGHPADSPSSPPDESVQLADRTDTSREGNSRHQIEDEIGDLLFAVVNLARKCKLDAEMALQKATDKFVARFNRLEDELESKGKRLGDVDLAELDQIWNGIKKMTKSE